MTLMNLTRVVPRMLALACALGLSGGGAATELGVYRWEAPAAPAKVDGFETWLARPVELAQAFEARDIWDNIDGAQWQLKPWSDWVRAKPGRNLILGVPMMPGEADGSGPDGIRGTADDVSLAKCAAGQYDVYWRNLANEFTYYGLHWAYLRLGWEMDGSWYSWGAPQGSGREASFAGCFRRMVQAMRSAQPANQWKFVWNPTATWTDAAYLGATWPGDTYVDVVAIDLYDQSWVPNTYPYPSACDSACRLARQQTAWRSHAWYLQTMGDFAKAHGKPFGIAEWGLYTRADGHGGGDNPYFVRKMHEFISDPANGVLFQVYFDVSAPDGDHHISSLDAPTKFPGGAAEYRQLFGAAATPTPIADKTPPSVWLSQPEQGTFIARRSTITLEAGATDNVGVAAVEISVNGRLVCRDVTSPYRCQANVGRASDGQYTITARATDAAGNAATYSRTYRAAK